MDGQLECLCGPLTSMQIHLSACASNAQVGEIEIMILTIKERARGIFNALPFTKLPGRIIVELIYSVVFWLNALGNSTAGDLSECTIMAGLAVSYKRHCRIEFGEYVQTHKDPDNTLQTRTICAIAICLTCNYQGRYFFISLVTAWKLNRDHWTPLPVPQDVIDCIHCLACCNPCVMSICNRDRHPLPDAANSDDKDEDETFIPL